MPAEAGVLSEAERAEAAEALAAAERQRVPIGPLVEGWPAVEVDDAYDIQLRNVRRRLGAGAHVRGHKVGLTSRAMQEMLGVDEPDYGHLLDDMFVHESGEVRAGDLCFPRIEPEIAFVLGEALHGPGVTVADVLRATAFVVPALEIIDSRIRDWRITLPDTIADNASSARAVLAGRRMSPTSLDLRLVGVVLRRNGEIVETGATGAVLGNPVLAIAWLANKLHQFGTGLQAGEVVLPGSCTRAVDVAPGDRIRADFDGLGHVAVRFT
jgi:2-keto-4-pentenoate hydratase